MILKVVEDNNYMRLMSSQIFEVIEYLIEKDQEFTITANIKGVSFSPAIPEPISENFPPFTVFALANYTYESLELNEDEITFEAGFGSENFGSVVTIPLYAIFQIIVDESILFLNPTATVEKYFKKKGMKKKVIEDDLDQETRSLNAFKFNKENEDLLN